MMNCHLNSFQIKSHKQRLVQGAPLNFKNNVPSLLEYLEVCLGSEYQKGNSLYWFAYDCMWLSFIRWKWTWLLTSNNCKDQKIFSSKMRTPTWLLDFYGNEKWINVSVITYCPITYKTHFLDLRSKIYYPGFISNQLSTK